MNYFCEACEKLTPTEDAVQLSEVHYRSLLMGGASATVNILQINNKHIVCKACVAQAQDNRSKKNLPHAKG